MIFSIDFRARILPARNARRRNNDEHDLVMIIEWRVVVFAQGAIMCQTSCFIVTQRSKLLPCSHFKWLHYKVELELAF